MTRLNLKPGILNIERVFTIHDCLMVQSDSLINSLRNHRVPFSALFCDGCSAMVLAASSVSFNEICGVMLEFQTFRCQFFAKPRGLRMLETFLVL